MVEGQPSKGQQGLRTPGEAANMTAVSSGFTFDFIEKGKAKQTDQAQACFESSSPHHEGLTSISGEDQQSAESQVFFEALETMPNPMEDEATIEKNQSLASAEATCDADSFITAQEHHDEYEALTQPEEATAASNNEEMPDAEKDYLPIVMFTPSKLTSLSQPQILSHFTQSLSHQEKSILSSRVAPLPYLLKRDQSVLGV